MQSKVYDFFISHSSEDNQKALELKQVLLSINPDWEIMLDCDIDHPFDYSDEWTDAMFEAVGSSRVLIFIASDESYLVEESGCWVYPEVKHFYLCKRDKKKNKDLNKAYFGVIFGDVDIGKVCRQREMYRELYSATQHIVLAADCPVSDAAQRLKNKISAVLKEADNSGVAEMLDMTRRFAKLHFGGDTPAEIGIDEDLCPVITIPEEMGGSVEKSRNDIGFNELVRFVANQNVGIINNDGGSGKTTILTRLFYHYLENFDVENIGNEMLVPIFVDAKTLLAENYLIPRYIAKYLYSEETAMSDRATGETEAKVLQEFAKATEHPQYLLLIDGYNEIPPFAVDDFDAELSQYVSDKYPNIRIVLSGRNIDSGVASFLAPVKLGRLRRYEIENYLKKCEVPMPSGKSLEKILCVPMYLSLYTKAAGTQAVIATRGDLLDQFMQWQLKKSENSELSKKEKAQNEIFLSHLLPAIACRLVMRPENVSNFIFTRDEAEEMLETAISQISSSQYMRWSSDRFIDRLEESQLEYYNIVKLTKSALKFYIKNCRLIDETADGEYEFIHQIYRDYLCAKHIVNEISINTKGSNPDLSSFALKQEKLEQPVVSFIAQILKEKRPYFDSNIECWNYDCNETSLVLKLLSLVRENGLCEEKTLIANIVEILKHIRTGDLSGCDFSGLDLSACDISACVFSRKDKQGVYAANFKGAFITEQNFFSADCFGFINAACVGKNCVITYDTSGMIKFRNLYSRGNYPEKTITGVEMPIHSLVYSDAENCLFGACQNTVFKIKVPEQAVAQVEYETVYTGESTVKELSLGPSDQVLFTTVDNPFNPKPLNAPKTPDTCSYKGFFAGAAVNAKGDELAFGHISRNNGLNICRKDENGEWSLVRDRYSELLQELFDALANKVKEYGLYESFNYISGHNLFDLLPSLFEDRTHRFHEIPSLVIGRMMKYFMDDENKNRPIATLNEQQWEELKKIADSYVEPIRVYTYRKFTLMIATGKSISSLQYKGDSNTLLVAATIDFNRFGKGNENRIKASERYETVVIEVDTKTHETNYIVRVIGARPAKAYYSKEGIIVYNSTFLSVYNQKGKVLKQLKTKPMDMGLFSSNGQDGFFIVAHHYIYEMDSNMRCVNAYPNRSNIDNVKYVSDASGVQRRFYFQKYNRTTKQTDNMCINADTGIVFTVDKLPASMRNAEPEITLASGRRFRRINQNMIAYDNAQKTEEFTVPYQLYVKGCDFTGLKGTLSEPHNLRLLDRFGALTDKFECCDMIIKTPAACYNPKRSGEAVEFKTPENLLNEYDLVGKLELQKVAPGYLQFTTDEFPKYEIYKFEMWKLIDNGFLKGELGDFARETLKWAVKLRLFTAEMIIDLVRSGHISQFSERSDEEIKFELDKVMVDKYRLLLRNQGIVKDKTVDVYCLNKDFGAHIGRQFGIEMLKLKPNLIVNRWVCRALKEFGARVKKVEFNALLNTDQNFFGNRYIDAYVRVDDTPLMAIDMRQDKKEVADKETEFITASNKLGKVVVLSEYYRDITCNTQKEQGIKQPIIVIIAADEQECFEIREMLKLTKIRIWNVPVLYTYEALFMSENENRYIVFKNGKAYNTSLEKEFEASEEN